MATLQLIILITGMGLKINAHTFKNVLKILLVVSGLSLLMR